MYTPKHFQLLSSEQQIQLIRSFPLATVVTPSYPAGSSPLPLIDPIPLLLDAGDTLEAWRLSGHVARVNPVWQQWQAAGEEGLPVLAVFRGPDCYISPSWYASKTVDHRVVPTWNYVQLNIYGRARAIFSANWLMQHIAALTEQEERGLRAPWSLADADPEYTRQLQRAIVGLEIHVERIEAKAKLSQNQPAANYASLCDALTAGDARQQGVLSWMLQQRQSQTEG